MIALAYIPVCVAFAWLNAKWIKDGKRIKHGWNGLLHIAVASVVAWFTEWYHFFTVLCIARIFFDVALNYFRGLPVDYVSPDPKSIVDKLEKKIFGKDGITPKILYLLITIILLIL